MPETILADWKRFVDDWQSADPWIEVQTSGSTGTPKRMRVRKEQMANSARMTCRYLGLQRGDKALLCMPLRYIAGKMMGVRALVAGLELVIREPSGHPLADVEESVRFAAMIPLQVYNTLQVPEERARLEMIERLIIGGGAIDPDLEAALRPLPGQIYSTYGMTETLSHIALRRLNGPEASLYYQPLPGVSLSLSAEGTLVIEAPAVAEGRLVTHDLAELLPDGRFRILGRRDNVIVSGGVKLQIEAIEEALRPLLQTGFAITSVPDTKFGEAVVLLLAPPHRVSELSQERLAERLSRYERPRHIWPVEAIPMTGTGKINRAACKAKAREIENQLTNK